MNAKQKLALAANTARKAETSALAHARNLEALAREKLAELDARSDTLLLRIVDSEWTIPALVAIAVSLVGVGVVIGRVF